MNRGRAPKFHGAVPLTTDNRRVFGSRVRSPSQMCRNWGPCVRAELWALGRLGLSLALQHSQCDVANHFTTRNSSTLRTPSECRGLAPPHHARPARNGSHHRPLLHPNLVRLIPNRMGIWQPAHKEPDLIGAGHGSAKRCLGGRHTQGDGRRRKQGTPGMPFDQQLEILAMVRTQSVFPLRPQKPSLVVIHRIGLGGHRKNPGGRCRLSRMALSRIEEGGECDDQGQCHPSHENPFVPPWPTRKGRISIGHFRLTIDTAAGLQTEPPSSGLPPRSSPSAGSRI